MFMVVILHVIGKGGILSAATGCKGHVVWLVETAAYCAVDCFAIISGFVSYNEIEKPYGYAKFFGFWLQVLTYSFGISLAAFLLEPESIGIKNVVKSFLPITTEQYWYVSAYTGLFFVIPWLNKLMRSCNRKEATCFITVILLVFAVYETFAHCLGDCFQLEDGYSFAWLSILYLFGAWLKKCDVPNLIRNRYFVLGSILCVVFSWATHEFLPYTVFKIFVCYTSITIVFVAIALVSVFSKLKIGVAFSKIIACFAPAAFGVYLIHEHPIIRSRFMSSMYIWIADFPALVIPITILGTAFCIFVICLFIEKARLILSKLLRISQLMSFAQKRLACLANTVFDKLASKI